MAHRDPHLAFGGDEILDRVREQVADDLREPVTVTVDGERVDGQIEQQAIAVRLQEEQLRLFAHQLDEVERCPDEREIAAAGQELDVEEVAGESGESASLGVDDLQVAALLLGAGSPARGAAR